MPVRHAPSKAGKTHPSFAREFVLRRIALSPRRLLAAAALGVVGALAFATSASACTIGVTGVANCDTLTGTYTVTWTVTASDDANVKSTTVTPSGTSITLPSGISGGGKGVTATQTVPGDQRTASLEVELTNAGKSPRFDLKKSGTVTLGGNCVVTASPSPSASAVVPPPASPSASQSAVAPASSAPASGTGAGGSLPVTGTSLTWFVVAAVVLIGGGTALFLVSRRRRTNA